MSAKETVLDSICNGTPVETFCANTIEEWVLIYAWSITHDKTLSNTYGATVKVMDGGNLILSYIENHDVKAIAYGLTNGYNSYVVEISDESKIIFKDCVERYGLSILPRIKNMCEVLGIELSHDFHKNVILRYHLGNTKK